MQFYISVYFQGKEYCLKVETTKLSRDLAEYKVSGKNRSIILQTNIPFLRSRAVKYKSASWKIIEGLNVFKEIEQLHAILGFGYQGISPPKGFLEDIIRQIENYAGN